MERSSYHTIYIVHQYRRRLQSRVGTGINAYFLGARNFSPHSNWQRITSKFQAIGRKEPINDYMDVDIVDEEIEICSAAPLVAINDFMQKPFVEVAGLYDKDDVNE